MSDRTTAASTIDRSERIDCLLLADWLPPDFGAIGQYALQFAEAKARSGLSVWLVGFTSGGHSREAHAVGSGFLTILRLPRRPYDRSNLLQRALWTLGANIRLLRGAWAPLKRANEIIFTGSPPYLLHFLAPLRGWFKGKLRYRIADFHPECLIASRGKPSFGMKMLERLTWHWRRRIDIVEIIAEDQRSRLVSNGVRPERIELRRDRSPVSFDGATKATVPEALAGRKIILYSGNWGVAHDASTFLAGLASMAQHERDRIGLWLNATGARADEVREQALALGVCVAHTPPCPLDQLAGVLLAADLHLICLSDAFVGLVLPSKVYACIDSDRPILYVGSSCSDVHALISAQRTERDYHRAAIGNADQVAASIRALLLEDGA